MAIKIEIEDSKISGFTTEAHETLKVQIEKYANDIIKETYLVEEELRENGASTEITSNYILQAVRKKKTYKKKKNNKFLIAMKILSALSILFTGFLFDPNGYKDNLWGFILFIIVLIIACVSTVLQFVLEDKE